LLGTLAVGFILLMVVQQVLTLVRSWLLLRVSTQLQVQWRSNVLAHMMRLPLDYFARRHLGDVMSRFGSIETIQRVLTSTFVEVALDGLMVILSLVLMLLYSPALTAIAVLSVVLYALIRLAWYGPLRRATAEHLVRSAAESTHLLETVRGMRTIRLFARNAERLGAWQSLMIGDVNADLRIQKLNIWYALVRRTLSGLFALLLLALGARDVISGSMSVGMLLAFLAYRGQFDSRFTELVNKYFELRMLGLDAQRLADIVLTPPERGTLSRAAVHRAGAPEIEIQSLSFRYAQGSPDVLEDLNLHIPAGQSVAIAGPSGCGKTTLVNLIMGIYTQQRGVIKIDGTPLHLYAAAWCYQDRRHTAVQHRTGSVAHAGGHGDARRRAVCGLYRRQHLLLRPERQPQLDRGVRAHGQHPRRHHAVPDGLPNPGGRHGHHTVGRAEAAGAAGASDVSPATDPGAG
jgi:ATP-binding cassette subfamily B protein RaxB